VIQACRAEDPHASREQLDPLSNTVRMTVMGLLPMWHGLNEFLHHRWLGSFVPVDATVVGTRIDEVELSWRADLVRTMRSGLRRARKLLAETDDLDKVTNLVDKLGGVGTAREALGVDGPRPDRSRQPAAEAPGSADAEGEGGEASDPGGPEGGLQ